MGSAAVSVTIQSDPLGKRFPAAGEMVRLEGRKGLFLVQRVDMDGGVADLMRRTGQRELLETSVPFEVIQAISQEASKAIQQFLGSDAENGGTAIARP